MKLWRKKKKKKRILSPAGKEKKKNASSGVPLRSQVYALRLYATGVRADSHLMKLFLPPVPLTGIPSTWGSTSLRSLDTLVLVAPILAIFRRRLDPGVSKAGLPSPRGYETNALLVRSTCFRFCPGMGWSALHPLVDFAVVLLILVLGPLL